MAEMSGENEMGGSPKLVLNTIRINGSKGTYVYQDVAGGLIEQPDGKKRYAVKNLGESVELVFLRVRRKLSQFKKGEKPLQTNEHTHKGQMVTLFGKEKPVQGYAMDIREQNPGLRTQQVVYAMYQGELVRVIFKGASLGSAVKDKKEHDFYSYMGSFSGKDDHFYEYKTELYTLEETSSMGSYYACGFRRGAKLSEEEIKALEEPMTTVFEYNKAIDAYYSAPRAGSTNTPSKSDSVLPDYAEDDSSPEDINPEDIPF